MSILRELLLGLQASIREARGRRERQDVPLPYMGRPPRKPRRKPPEAGLPIPAVPPRGPLPKQGGAEAPLEFSDQRDDNSERTQATRSTSSPSLDRRAST
jgi:hypothetical protein